MARMSLAELVCRSIGSCSSHSSSAACWPPSGGVLDTLQIGAISAYLGKGMEFNAVAVIVVGGVSLFGGRGNILSSVVLGALVFELIRNGLNHLGANPYAYRLVSGAVIFAAMYADALKSRAPRAKVGAPAPVEA